MTKKIYINPPPTDRKCERCQVHINDLKSFGKEGDPLVGNFEGQKLVKIFRAMLEERKDKELNKILDYQDVLMENSNNNWSEEIQTKLEEKFGAKKVDNAYLYDQLLSTVGPSWECRDCIIK